jgi:hypothetical protein
MGHRTGCELDERQLKVKQQRGARERRAAEASGMAGYVGSQADAAAASVWQEKLRHTEDLDNKAWVPGGPPYRGERGAG